MPAPVGNKYAVGNNGGRPVMYDNPDDLKSAFDEYFEYIKGEVGKKTVSVKNEETGECDQKEVEYWIRQPEPPMITAMALYVGFSGRSVLYDYSKKEEFSTLVKRAMTRVEMGYEYGLNQDKPTGSIFALKNMGWADRQIQEITGKDGDPLFNATDDELKQLLTNTLSKLNG